MKTPKEYRAFARDMMKLCKKHGIRLLAHNEGTAFLGPAKGRLIVDFPYDEFEFSPDLAALGYEHDTNSIRIGKDSG